MENIAKEFKIAGKPARVLFTGVFISDDEFDAVLELRDEYISRKDLPELTEGCWYGWDYSGRIVKMHPKLGREEELDVYFTSEEMEGVIEFMEGVTGKYGFPNSTKRCVIGIQKNKEITVCVKQEI